MIALGIETSCDETAAAIVEENGRVRSDIIHSQIATHQPYGGVIPELASRDHVEHLARVVREALTRASCTLADVDLIGVTCRPGLSGALLVGVQAAKGLAWGASKPIYGVDHLIGHLVSPFLVRGDAVAPRPAMPHVALLVSGGHTALYRVRGFLPEHIDELGATRDDAAGEAFDKASKLLGLGYPGGPEIQRAAMGGDARAVKFLAPMRDTDSFDFSFSGLKTQIRSWVDRHGVPTGHALADVCASLQACVVDVLVHKTVRAAIASNVSAITIGGGVAANGPLRDAMARVAAERGIACAVPELASTTDNAAMIALCALLQARAGRDADGFALGVETKTSIAVRTRKGRGLRT